MLWAVGTVAHLALTLYVLGTWMDHGRYRVKHMNPAWFIPAVGNVIVPVAGVPLGYGEISWFFFAAGIMSWVVLLAVVTNRILFHEPIEERLLPSLFIMIAPPSVGFIAWVRLNGGELDGASRVLYFFGLFLALLLLTRAGRFARLAFGLPSWAYSFPLAAISIATLLMYEVTGADVYRWLGAVLLGLTSVVAAILAALTVRDIAAGRICVPGR